MQNLGKFPLVLEPVNKVADEALGPPEDEQSSRAQLSLKIIVKEEGDSILETTLSVHDYLLKWQRPNS